MDLDRPQFGMRELKQVVGKTDATLQNWRGRGLIADGIGGWRVFSARDILRIALFADLTDHGYPPSTAKGLMDVIDENGECAVIRSGADPYGIGELVDESLLWKSCEPPSDFEVLNTSSKDAAKHVAAGKNSFVAVLNVALVRGLVVKALQHLS